MRFSPNSSNPIIVSCGWDKLVKVNQGESGDQLPPGGRHASFGALINSGEDLSSQIGGIFFPPLYFRLFLSLFVPTQVWNLANCKLKTNHIGHTGYLNTVTVSPDGSLCASGGKVRVLRGN